MKSLSLTPPRRALPNFSSKSPTAIIDFETYYTDEYSVKLMSYWHYCHHPLFNAYLVSIVTSDGFEWVGAPKNAPWDRIRDYVWVSHNRPFDEAVWTALQEAGTVPSWDPHYWGNSINLCAWVRVPRALSMAVGVLFNVRLSKSVRDEIKNQKPEEFSEDLWVRLRKYALDDGRWPLRIWLENCDSWPMKERRIADMIDDRGTFGLYADKAGMEKDMSLMAQVIDAALHKLPWMTEEKIAKLYAGEKVTVIGKADCNKQCRDNGIEPPASLAMDDEDLIKWEEKYGDLLPFVGAMRDYRRMNGMLKKYKRIFERIKPNGRFEFSVTYLGTHTGRTSGRDKAEERKGANMLNMPRDPYFVSPTWTVYCRKDDMKRIGSFIKKNDGKFPDDVAYSFYLRGRILPGPGMKFVICDKAQIEARITNWLAGDKKTLDMIRAGISVYDAHAVTLMGHIPEVVDGKPISLKKSDPGRYALAKARELALGFQAGHVKFLVMAPMYVSDEEFKEIFDKPYQPEQASRYTEWLETTRQTTTLKEFNDGNDYLKRIRIQSWLQVNDFRSKKPSLTAPGTARKPGLWARLDRDLKASVSTGLYEVELPSGRVLKYFNVRMSATDKKSVVARVERGGDFKPYYGGKILENCLSGDTLVLTKLRGWVRLDSVSSTEKVWDGEEFVTHSGLSMRGEKETGCCHGVFATGEHLFLTTAGWVRANSACNLPLTDASYPDEQQALHPASGETRETRRQDIRQHDRPTTARIEEREESVGSLVQMRESVPEGVDGLPQIPGGVLTQMPPVDRGTVVKDDRPRDVESPRVRSLGVHETTLFRPESPRVPQLRGEGHQGVQELEQVIPGVLDLDGVHVESGAGPRSEEKRSGVQAVQLPVDHEGGELTEQTELRNSGVGVGRGEEKPHPEVNAGLPSKERSPDDSCLFGRPRRFEAVYDLLNCGPRSRFAVKSSPDDPRYLIAHNCAQAFARDVFVDDQINLYDIGVHVPLDIYDEVITEVPLDFEGNVVAKIMSTPPDWCPTLPVGAEFEESMFYKK